jgi:hypothetical protein
MALTEGESEKIAAYLKTKALECVCSLSDYPILCCMAAT